MKNNSSNNKNIFYNQEFSFFNYIRFFWVSFCFVYGWCFLEIGLQVSCFWFFGEFFGFYFRRRKICISQVNLLEFLSIFSINIMGSLCCFLRGFSFFFSQEVKVLGVYNVVRFIVFVEQVFGLGFSSILFIQRGYWFCLEWQFVQLGVGGDVLFIGGIRDFVSFFISFSLCVLV